MEDLVESKNLAVVKRIIDVQPAKDSDYLDIVHVDGWKSVVRKEDGFKAGDLCVFVCIDSILPAGFPGFSEDEPTKIKTRKMRGNLSQGLVVPTAVLNGNPFYEGMDVTEQLGITKYQKAIINDSLIVGSFPSHLVPKTDEPHVQSYPDCLAEMLGLPYVMTIKEDGRSCTMLYSPDGDFKVCSRNCELHRESNCAEWELARKYMVEDILSDYKHYAIQGEVCGPKINGNRAKYQEYKFFVFDVYDMKNQQYLGYKEFSEFINTYAVLPSVEVVERGEYFSYNIGELTEIVECIHNAASFIKEANLPLVEGIVVRPLKPVYSPTLQRRLSFKVCNPKYLLAEN